MKRTLITLATIAMALVSCNKQEAARSVEFDGTPVKFTASMAQQYQVKSTTVDNPFDVDKQVGIFAGAPIVANNYAYKVSSMPTTEPAAAGALIPVDEENPILWNQGQSAATTFYAYAPLGESTDAAAISASVLTDQTSLDKVNTSDFMAATALNVTPGAAAGLEFSHKFHKIIVLVENKLAQDVTNVAVKNVKVAATVNLTDGTITPTGEATSVVNTFATGTTVNRTIAEVNHTYDVYTAIIVPQTAQPQIVITVGTNTTYTYSLASEMNFSGNQTATATLTVESAAASANAASFSFTLAEWGANTDMEYGAGSKGISNPDQWSVIGNIMGTSWNQDFYMAENPENSGEYMVTIKYNKDEEFKFRFGSAWKDETHTDEKYKQYGASSTSALSIKGDGHTLIGSNNQNIKIDVSDEKEHTFTLYLNPTSGHLYIDE